MNSIVSRVRILLMLFMFSIICSTTSYSQIVKPEDHFGFKPGADKELFTYEQLISYLQKLDAASPKLKMINIGESPLGKPMYLAFFSSAKNIENLDRLKEINKALAKDASLSETEVTNLVDEGKVFFLATLSMHSSEVGPSQSAPLIA